MYGFASNTVDTFKKISRTRLAALAALTEGGQVHLLDQDSKIVQRQPGSPQADGQAQSYARAIAAATIPRNESALSEAPPTKAPSMLGWANSSPALSGLTLPP